MTDSHRIPYRRRPRSKCKAQLVMTAIALCAAGAPAAASAPGFASPFGEHMVLQRDRPLVLRGHAAPGAELEVVLLEHSAAVVADDDGRWRATLPPLPAGGPHTVELRQHGRAVTVLNDVLVGDVWLCSGQSNMEYPVSAATGSRRDAYTPQPAIRLLTVGHDSATRPREVFSRAADWQRAEAAAIREFSAVCYLFARDLAASEDVPTGLVQASWGSSRIEAWLSTGALERLGGFGTGLEQLSTWNDDRAAGLRAFGTAWQDWWTREVSATDQPWRDAAVAAGWPGAPLRNWKTWGDPELEQHNGMVWYVNSVELSAAQAAQDAELALGGIDEVDLTWVNGVLVGTQFGWGTPRRYPVSADVLKPGRNSIVVNVLSTWDAGGLVGPAEDMALEFAGGRVPLGDGWRYRRAPAGLASPRAPWGSINSLAGLHNAMLAPLAGLPLRGALWYQGESNAGEPESYRALLAALTDDWRRLFAAADLPVIVVQLPNFGARPRSPVDSGWAAIRDAQRQVALAEPATGLVVTLDAGDDFDLHPPNKQVVASRAAAVARALTYGAGGTADGHSPLAARRDGDEIAIEFAAGSGLMVVGDARPVAFELCTDAPGSCRYADARLAGDVIRLASPDGANRVRHCWADAPVCNLFGAGGLPVGSFEIAVSP